MKDIIAKAILLVVIAEAIAILYFGMMAYFVTNSDGGRIYDGLGREINQSPWLFHFITRQESWAGIKWFVVETVGFWLAVGFGYTLLQVKESLES